jgi:hypothetical protein
VGITVPSTGEGIGAEGSGTGAIREGFLDGARVTGPIDPSDGAVVRGDVDTKLGIYDEGALLGADGDMVALFIKQVGDDATSRQVPVQVPSSKHLAPTSSKNRRLLPVSLHANDV